jgi:transposase
MSRLEQRAVIRYLILKNLSVAEIATELQNVYGTDALKYSTVSKSNMRFQDGSNDLFDFALSGKPSRSDLATPIQSLLQQFPFISCKILCRKLKIGKATCLRVLHDDSSGKVQFTLYSAFTGSRSKAVAGRAFPRASPDTRTRHYGPSEQCTTAQQQKKVRQLFLQQKLVESLPQPTVQINFRVTSSLECSRNECWKHRIVRQRNRFMP